MIFIRNKIFPPFFKAITIWPFVFCRKELSVIDRLHEKIHGKQQVELLFIGFYLLYIFFSLFRKYRDIPFEREAYANERNNIYLTNRKLYNWINYIKSKA